MIIDIIYPLLPFIISLLLVGALAGFLAGLLGVGGGIIMVPALFYSLSFIEAFAPYPIIKIAVATSLACILPTGISSAWAHYKKNNIDFTTFKRFLPGLIIGVLLGNWLLYKIEASHVQLLFAVLAFIVGVQFIIQTKGANANSDNHNITVYPFPVHDSISGFVGAISALIGIGGASLSVPIMHFLGASLKKAVGTASLLGVFIALFSVISQIYFSFYVEINAPFMVGYVNIGAFIILISTSIICAPVGAYCTHIISASHLKKIFGVFLLIISFSLLLKTI